MSSVNCGLKENPTWVKKAMEAGRTLTGKLTKILAACTGVTSEIRAYPTPCSDWDVRTLLDHLNDSITALYEAVDVGRVRLVAVAGGPDPRTDPVASVRDGACALVGACANADTGHRDVSIAGTPLATGLLTSAGAIEVTVHGWDVARSCGRHHPIPDALAAELLMSAPLLISGGDGPLRFVAEIEVPPGTGAGDRRVAFLGRPRG